MIKIDNLSLKKKIPVISRLDLKVEAGEVYVLLASGDRAVDHLINIFTGLETGFKGSVEVDDCDLLSSSDSCRNNIAYLSSGEQWPQDMKVGNILSFFKKNLEIPEEQFEELYIKLNMENLFHKKISDIQATEWRNILFTLLRLKKCKNYIFRDFAGGMPLDFNLEFKKRVLKLKKQGASILYFGDDVFFAPEIGDRIGFMKKGKLLLELKASKMKKMSLRELYFQFLAEKN